MYMYMAFSFEFKTKLVADMIPLIAKVLDVE